MTIAYIINEVRILVPMNPFLREPYRRFKTTPHPPSANFQTLKEMWPSSSVSASPSSPSPKKAEWLVL